MNDYSSMSIELDEKQAPASRNWRGWMAWPPWRCWAGVGLHASPAVADKGAQAPIVSVIIPGAPAWRATINATGLLAAKHDMPIASVGEGGQVAQVLVNAGDWVKQGQLLAVIDRSVQVEQDANQQAQVRVSRPMRLAQANLDRALKLVDRGFISANIDQLTATRDAADARVRVPGQSGRDARASAA
jgi:multidrug efflux pump subunit AcrA (membrane-fusion protein)